MQKFVSIARDGLQFHFQKLTADQEPERLEAYRQLGTYLSSAADVLLLPFRQQLFNSEKPDNAKNVELLCKFIRDIIKDKFLTADTATRNKLVETLDFKSYEEINLQLFISKLEILIPDIKANTAFIKIVGKLNIDLSNPQAFVQPANVHTVEIPERALGLAKLGWQAFVRDAVASLNGDEHAKQSIAVKLNKKVSSVADAIVLPFEHLFGGKDIDELKKLIRKEFRNKYNDPKNIESLNNITKVLNDIVPKDLKQLMQAIKKLIPTINLNNEFGDLLKSFGFSALGELLEVKINESKLTEVAPKVVEAVKGIADKAKSVIHSDASNPVAVLSKVTETVTDMVAKPQAAQAAEALQSKAVTPETKDSKALPFSELSAFVNSIATDSSALKKAAVTKAVEKAGKDTDTDGNVKAEHLKAIKMELEGSQLAAYNDFLAKVNAPRQALAPPAKAYEATLTLYAQGKIRGPLGKTINDWYRRFINGENSAYFRLLLDYKTDGSVDYSKIDLYELDDAAYQKGVKQHPEIKRHKQTTYQQDSGYNQHGRAGSLDTGIDFSVAGLEAGLSANLKRVLNKIGFNNKLKKIEYFVETTDVVDFDPPVVSPLKTQEPKIKIQVRQGKENVLHDSYLNQYLDALLRDIGDSIINGYYFGREKEETYFRHDSKDASMRSVEGSSSLTFKPGVVSNIPGGHIKAGGASLDQQGREVHNESGNLKEKEGGTFFKIRPFNTAEFNHALDNIMNQLPSFIDESGKEITALTVSYAPHTRFHQGISAAESKVYKLLERANKLIAMAVTATEISQGFNEAGDSNSEELSGFQRAQDAAANFKTFYNTELPDTIYMLLERPFSAESPENKARIARCENQLKDFTNGFLGLKTIKYKKTLVQESLTLGRGDTEGSSGHDYEGKIPPLKPFKNLGHYFRGEKGDDKKIPLSDPQQNDIELRLKLDKSSDLWRQLAAEYENFEISVTIAKLDRESNTLVRDNVGVRSVKYIPSPQYIHNWQLSCAELLKKSQASKPQGVKSQEKKPAQPAVKKAYFLICVYNELSTDSPTYKIYVMNSYKSVEIKKLEVLEEIAPLCQLIDASKKVREFNKSELPLKVIQWLYDEKFMPPYFQAIVDLELIFGYLAPGGTMKMVSREANFELSVSNVELDSINYLNIGDVIHYRGDELTRDLAVDDIATSKKKNMLRKKAAGSGEADLWSNESETSNARKKGVVLYLKKTKIKLNSYDHSEIPKGLKKFKLEISQIAEVNFSEGITNASEAGENLADEATTLIAKRKAQGEDITPAEKRVLDESLEINFFKIMRMPNADWVKISQALTYIDSKNILVFSPNLQNDIIASLVDCVERINKDMPDESDMLISLMVHVFINCTDILTDKNNGVQVVRHAISWLVNTNQSIRQASFIFLDRCFSRRYDEIGLGTIDYQNIPALFDAIKSDEDAIELLGFIRLPQFNYPVSMEEVLFDKVLALLAKPETKWCKDYQENLVCYEGLDFVKEMLSHSKNIQFILNCINKIVSKALERSTEKYFSRGLSHVLNILSERDLNGIMIQLRVALFDQLMSFMVASKADARKIECLLEFYDQFFDALSKYLVSEFNGAPLLEKLVVEVSNEFKASANVEKNKYYLEGLLYICRWFGGYLQSFYSCNDAFMVDVTRASQSLIQLFSGEVNELGKKVKIDSSMFLKLVDSFCRIKKIPLSIDPGFILPYLNSENFGVLVNIRPRRIGSRVSEIDNSDMVLEMIDYYPHLFAESAYIEALLKLFNQLSYEDAGQLDYKSWVLDILVRVNRSRPQSFTKEQYNILEEPSTLNFTSEPHCFIVETYCSLGIKLQIDKIKLLEDILVNICNADAKTISQYLNLLQSIEAVDLIDYMVRRLSVDKNDEGSLIGGVAKTLAILSVNYELEIELKVNGKQLECSQKNNDKVVVNKKFDVNDTIIPEIDKFIKAFIEAEKQEKRLSSLVKPKEVSVIQDRRSSNKRDTFIAGYVSNKYRVMFQYPSVSSNDWEECLQIFRTDRKSVLELLMKQESRKTLLEKNSKLFSLLIYEFHRHYLLSSSTAALPNENKGLTKLVDALRSKTSAPTENSPLMLACSKLTEALKNKAAMKEPDERVIDLCNAAEKELGEQMQGKVYEDYLNLFQDGKKSLSVAILVCFAVLKELPCRVWFKSDDVLTLYSSNAVQEGSSNCVDFMLVGGYELSQVTDFSQCTLLVPVPSSSQRAQSNDFSRPSFGVSTPNVRFFSQPVRKVSKSWQLKKFKLPNQDLEVFDVNVPGDNTCLFYAIALGYLLPVLGDNDKFKSRVDALFKLHDEVIEYEKLRKILSAFEGQTDFISRGDNSGFLEALINVNLRTKIVAYMRDNSHYSEFLGHFQEEFFSDLELTADALRARFDHYLDDMQAPKGSWGGNLEILACIQLLNVDFNIYVISKNGTDLEPSMTADKSNPKPNGEINLFYTSMIVGGAKNHYHVLIDPKHMPNSDEKLTSGIEPPK